MSPKPINMFSAVDLEKDGEESKETKNLGLGCGVVNPGEGRRGI